MSLVHLDSTMFHSAVVYACHQVVGQQETLNAINIFPVPDGDTGNNMAGTAIAIINNAEIRPTFQLTCKSIADASILGARGNSGMIFSQFFNGLLEFPQWSETLDTKQFATLISMAAASARDAVLNPVEGTILTVMDAWARSLKQHASKIQNFSALVPVTLDDVKTALASTSTLLEVLKQAHVVDAGAMGFSVFIEGFYDYILNPHPLAYETQNVRTAKVHHDEVRVGGAPPDKRYCTEAVIYGDAVDKEAIKKIVEVHGNSVVLTANRGMCRIHLHCDEPWHVFGALKSQGAIRYPKVDDMKAQYQMLHVRKTRIALMTDTGADIPQSIADDYHIHFIPANVHMDGHDLLDKYCIDAKHFYDEIDLCQEYPVTSFPSLKQIEDKIRQVARHHEEVLILSLSQALSGTHDAIVNIAKKYSNIHVINTRLISGAQGLLLNYAAELIADGFSLNAIKDALTQKIAKTRFLIMVKSMDSLMRSGRIGKVTGQIAKWMGFKPILTLDPIGKMVSTGQAMTERAALNRLIQDVKKLAKEAGGLENYCIIHANAPERARELAILTTEAFGHEPAYIESVATSVGLHAGKGSVALAAMFK